MASTRIGTLATPDRAAVFSTAQRLGLDPYEFGALIHQESGFRPNVWGGAGGAYRGLIQFGPGARKEVGLPDKEMSIAEQLPYVEKYFQGRGYKPGMGIAKAYATVLGGNPNVSLNAKDSFGTSVASSLPRFQKGGELYNRAQGTLGDPLNGLPTVSPQAAKPPAQQQLAGNTYNFYLNPDAFEGDGTTNPGAQFLQKWLPTLLKQQKQPDLTSQLADVLGQNYYPATL
jgi:hypothetical protein